MNIRLGIYEIFSRIIPGGVYIVAIVQFLSVLGFVSFDMQATENLSLVASIGFIVIAYILGGAFDNLALVLFRLFNKAGFSERTLAEFNKKHEEAWQIDFQDRDWPVLLAFIRTKNFELAGELDRHNALPIMLRNVSLGLLFMIVNSVIQFFVSQNPVNVLISIIMLVVSMLILREAVKFRKLFYDGIYETVLAYRVDLETVIKSVHSGEKRIRAEKGKSTALPDHKKKVITKP